MHPTKAELITRNGLKCMICGKEFPYKQIQWHHIKPRAVSKYLNEPADDSYENGALLCIDCHAFVHTLYYWSYEYNLMMDVVRRNKK